MNKKTCVFAPCYNENNILEWMDYHYKIGFDYIVIYDDASDISVKNMIDESKIFDKNKYYIMHNIVKQYLSKEGPNNLPNYSIRSNYFFNELKKIIIDYDYILSIDIDEYLYLGNFKNIHELIKFYEPFDSLYIYWKTFCGLKKYSNHSLIGNFMISRNLEFIGKCLGKIKNIFSQTSPHCYDTFINTIYYPNEEFNFINKDIFNNYFELSIDSGLKNLDYNTFIKCQMNNKIIPYIAHYRYQSIESFLKRRLIDRSILIKNNCSETEKKKLFKFFMYGEKNYEQMINNKFWPTSNPDINMSINFIYNQKNNVNRSIVDKYDSENIKMENIDNISKIFWSTNPEHGKINYDLYDVYFMERSRIHIINEYIVVTNMKVMYSSLNLLKTIKLDDIEANELIKSYKNNGYIFLYRNIIERVISCFINWCLNNHEKKDIMELLVNVDGFDYLLFNNLIENNNIIESFKMFIHAVKYLIHDNHLIQQSSILKYLDIDASNINYFINIDNNNDITLFENLINEKLEKINTSDIKIKIELNVFLLDEKNISYINILKKIYNDDIVFFNKKNIKII